MTMKISDAVMKELQPYEKLLTKASVSRSIYVPQEEKSALADIYSRIVGNDQACKACNNTWVIRLGVWYMENKKDRKTAVPTGDPGQNKQITKNKTTKKRASQGKQDDKRTV